MITRITFDDLGNLVSIEYQDGTSTQTLIKDIEMIRAKLIDINEKYPNTIIYEPGEMIRPVQEKKWSYESNS